MYPPIYIDVDLVDSVLDANTVRVSSGNPGVRARWPSGVARASVCGVWWIDPLSRAPVRLSSLHRSLLFSASHMTGADHAATFEYASNPWVSFLTTPGHGPVTSLAWSPSGRVIATECVCE